MTEDWDLLGLHNNKNGAKGQETHTHLIKNTMIRSDINRSPKHSYKSTGNLETTQ